MKRLRNDGNIRSTSGRKIIKNRLIFTDIYEVEDPVTLKHKTPSKKFDFSEINLTTPKRKQKIQSFLNEKETKELINASSTCENLVIPNTISLENDKENIENVEVNLFAANFATPKRSKRNSINELNSIQRTSGRKKKLNPTIFNESFFTPKRQEKRQALTENANNLEKSSLKVKPPEKSALTPVEEKSIQKRHVRFNENHDIFEISVRQNIRNKSTQPEELTFENENHETSESELDMTFISSGQFSVDDFINEAFSMDNRNESFNSSSHLSFNTSNGVVRNEIPKRKRSHSGDEQSEVRQKKSKVETKKGTKKQHEVPDQDDDSLQPLFDLMSHHFEVYDPVPSNYWSKSDPQPCTSLRLKDSTQTFSKSTVYNLKSSNEDPEYRNCWKNEQYDVTFQDENSN